MTEKEKATGHPKFSYDDELLELFTAQTDIVQWAVSLLRLFDAQGGRHPVIVDEEMFNILRDLLSKVPKLS